MVEHNIAVIKGGKVVLGIQEEDAVAMYVGPMVTKHCSRELGESAKSHTPGRGI